jgi:hypothetical protein
MKGDDHKIKEIESRFFQEIKRTIMRSKVIISGYQKLVNFIHLFMRSKVANNAFATFDLMKNYLVTSGIMKFKVDYNAFLTFDLMIVLVTDNFFRRSKVENNGS